MNKRINDLTLVAYTNEVWEHACPTIRIICPIEKLGFHLIKGTDWEEGFMHIYPERIKEADAILIQRDFPRNIVEYEEIMALARSVGKYVIYELDDLLPEIPVQHPDFYSYRSSRPAIIRAILEADAVVGSTRTMCDYMRQFNPNVWELPNYLDDRFWDLKSSAITENDSLIVGYMGGHSHSYDLEITTPLLIQFLKEYSDRIKVKYWGLEPPAALRNFSSVEWDNVALVDYHKFAAYFQNQKCDIFLAPLQDNLFNRCKSHLKYLEYSALAVPGVYSRITPYEEDVAHGKNGYLASSLEEWKDCIYQLIENPSLRSKIGAKAQSYVRNHWMLSHLVNRWQEFYEYIASTKDRSTRSYLTLNATRKIQSFYTEVDTELKIIKEEEKAERIKLREEMDAERRNWEEKLHQAQVQLEVLQNQLLESDRVNLEVRKFSERYYYLYHDILNTNSWKVLGVLAKLRLKLAPEGSKRDGLVRFIIDSPRILQREGYRSFLRSIKHQTRELINGYSSKTSTGSLQLQPFLLDTPGCSMTTDSLPIISILIIKDPGLPQINIRKLRNWIQNQTYRNLANIVVWDRIGHFARVIDLRGKSKQVEGMKRLCDFIKTRYLCIASENLIQEAATYLETNLIALESQSLAFTVNLYGSSEWTRDLLGQGFLPGNESLPLLRQVVMKECVRDDFSLDLSPWINKRQRQIEESQENNRLDFPVVAGRIISHPTTYDDKEGSLPFSNMIHGQKCVLQGKDLLIIPTDKQIWESCIHPVISINKIIHPNPVLSETPTVIVVMPFLAVGGAEQVLLEVMQQLKSRIRFVVVTFEEYDPALGTTADAFRQITPFVYTIPDFVLEIQYASFITYLIERFNPSTIYIANGTNWIYNALEAIKETFPSLRIVDQVYDAQVGWINRYDLPVIMYTDGHIGVNEKICQAYVQKGVKPEQVFLIEHGVNSDGLNPSDYPDSKKLQLKENLGLNSDKKTVTFASRLHPQKRPMDFVELARCFSSDPSVDFLMVGNGPLAPRVDDQIKKLGLKNIHRNEFYRPISDILAISDVLVLPSEFEGMPMIAIEAQTMGKPVVVTDVGNNREMIEYTGGGTVVSRIGDVSAMVQAVKNMLRIPPDPDQLRRLTLSRFDIKLIAHKYLEPLLGEHSDDPIRSS